MRYTGMCVEVAIRVREIKAAPLKGYGALSKGAVNNYQKYKEGARGALFVK